MFDADKQNVGTKKSSCLKDFNTEIYFMSTILHCTDFTPSFPTRHNVSKHSCFKIR